MRYRYNLQKAIYTRDTVLIKDPKNQYVGMQFKDPAIICSYMCHSVAAIYLLHTTDTTTFIPDHYYLSTQNQF